MPRILLIDDDRSLHRLLGQYLEGAGYTVLHAASGQAGLQQLYELRPDLILLDVMMPRMDGWETCRRIRELTDVPVIFLTARDDEPDRLRGFRLGCDDYVAKPFSFPELAARIEAVLRRGERGEKAGAAPDDVLVCGPFTMDRARHVVMRDGEPVDLTPTEYRLLELFMSRPDVVIAQEQLVTDIWGPEYADAVGYVRRYVWHLRQRIEPDPENPRHLLTERGFGYRFRGDPAD